MLSQLGCAIILRVPLVHGINDDNENIRRIGEFAASLPHIRGVDLLPYHHLGVDKYVRLNKVYSLPGILPPSPDRMAEIAHFLGTFGLSVRTGG
jgi:pyruvate formate lyase activating enzyme